VLLYLENIVESTHARGNGKYRHSLLPFLPRKLLEVRDNQKIDLATFGAKRLEGI
jgi:hypothetical protein